MKLKHEVRDPVHGFVHFNHLEKKLIDSRPFQRLRNIHQLAMSYQVYPGACHSRFEHSLGVMQLAGYIFDALFQEDKLSDEAKERLGAYLLADNKAHWRQVLRIAALLHDVGHLPFSHAAEHLLPAGMSHETITGQLILDSEITEILEANESPIRAQDVVDLAMDAKKRRPDQPALPPWKTILNEIICGDVFGADRFDYLRRDSYHAGVSYGEFDPTRLIEGLRVVVDPEQDNLALGLQRSCLQASEAVLLARYFMYSQVYFHHVRKAYDKHLEEYLAAWLPNGKFNPATEDFLKMTDDEVLAAIRADIATPEGQRHKLALRLLGRQHFRTVYEFSPPHVKEDPEVVENVFEAVLAAVGSENCHKLIKLPKLDENKFPIILEDGKTIHPSPSMSTILASIPPVRMGLVIVDRTKLTEAKQAVKTVLDPIEQEIAKRKAKAGDPPEGI